MTTPTPRRTASTNGTPDVVTSPIAGALLVAELHEAARGIAAGRLVRDLPRIEANRVRMLLRTARQFGELHGTEDDDLDAELDNALDRPAGDGETDGPS